MKKTTLVVTGTAILMCALLILVQHKLCKRMYEQQHTTKVQQDALQQSDEDDMPTLTIGIPVNLY